MPPPPPPNSPIEKLNALSYVQSRPLKRPSFKAKKILKYVLHVDITD
jgi:hypothetical protein